MSADEVAIMIRIATWKRRGSRASIVHAMPSLPAPWLSIAAVGASQPVIVEMVADVVCPYCHIGLKRLERAIAATSHAANIHVRYTPFILRRHLPKEGVPKREVFREQFGSYDKAERVISQVVETASEDGLVFNLTTQMAGNSEDAHRLMMWAGPKAVTLFEDLAKAYNQEQLWVGDHDVLVRSASRSNLDREAAGKMLADPSAYQDELEAGLRRARSLGVTSVPAFFVNGVLLGTGALSEGALRSVLEHTCAAE